MKGYVDELMGVWVKRFEKKQKTLSVLPPHPGTPWDTPWDPHWDPSVTRGDTLVTRW